ncbi:hypothetical protein SAMD00019534_116700 [Acytostelium subglobosum LB1]|uniref:hypothetical protein n=1 Tax=Acytostelium subglobosum LB1 TaxID=1410327 RepID=UPI00064484F6|nr:hypothetical protein SAMD00019534_116700 [Acytostelium subglobosum LB1]GAM28494.1 hypothetical protein SAMD00019534_116700 [Acytostelium subglobosum LB1]|eukprot:XP_012748533.1 hypothetical protein SAMD00019534_116700 [Acytostelium subglobosum LB1]
MALINGLLNSQVKDKLGLQAISFTTNTLDNPYRDLPPQPEFNDQSEVPYQPIRSLSIPLLHKMNNLTSLELQFQQSVQDNGLVDKLQQFYAGAHSLNKLVLYVTSVNVIHLLPHCQTTPIKSLNLMLYDMNHMAFLSAKGKLHQLFHTMATHLQQTMIKHLEYLSINMNNNGFIFAFNNHYLSTLITALQLHCINDRLPINFYRLVD